MDDFIQDCYCKAILEIKINKKDFLDMTPYEFSLLYDYHIKHLKSEKNLERDIMVNAIRATLSNEKIRPLFKEEKTNRESSNINNNLTREELEKFKEELESNQNLKDKIQKEREELFRDMLT